MDMRNHSQNQGFSLVELLVTMVVVSLVILAATTTFIVQNKMATIQAATSDIQLTGQLTMDLLSRDIRMAGYGFYGADKENALFHFDNALSSDTERMANTDAIQVRYSIPSGECYYKYYIAKTGDGGLFRQNLLLPTGTPGAIEPIASSVEDMQVKVFNNSTTGSKKVDLTLVLKSAAKDNGYGTDGYRRRKYTATIAARNYGL